MGFFCGFSSWLADDHLLPGGSIIPLPCVSVSPFLLILRTPVVRNKVDWGRPQGLILTYLLNDPISKQGYIPRYWALGLQYMNGGQVSG